MAEQDHDQETKETNTEENLDTETNNTEETVDSEESTDNTEKEETITEETVDNDPEVVELRTTPETKEPKTEDLEVKLTKSQLEELINSAVEKAVTKTKNVTEKKENLTTKTKEDNMADNPNDKVAELEAKLAAMEEKLASKNNQDDIIAKMQAEFERRDLEAYKAKATKGLMFADMVSGSTKEEIDASVKLVKEREQKIRDKAQDDAASKLSSQYTQLRDVKNLNDPNRDASKHPVTLKEKMAALGKNKSEIQLSLTQRKRKALFKKS